MLKLLLENEIKLNVWFVWLKFFLLKYPSVTISFTLKYCQYNGQCSVLYCIFHSAVISCTEPVWLRLKNPFFNFRLQIQELQVRYRISTMSEASPDEGKENPPDNMSVQDDSTHKESTLVRGASEAESVMSFESDDFEDVYEKIW